MLRTAGGGDRVIRLLENNHSSSTHAEFREGKSFNDMTCSGENYNFIDPDCEILVITELQI